MRNTAGIITTCALAALSLLPAMAQDRKPKRQALPAPAEEQQAPPTPAQTQQATPRTVFEVRYVGAGSVYISGGRDEGLAEGFHFTIRHLKDGDPETAAVNVAKATITALATHSAVCQIDPETADVKIGDKAILTTDDAAVLTSNLSSKSLRHYAQVVSFSESDPLEEELREYVPRPPSPEVNRIRGRISFEHSMVMDHSFVGAGSREEGIVLRADMTRIAGSFWNLTGYWRGRFDFRGGSASTQTVTDLLNRTYHIGLYYNNPVSKYTMGFGRLLIPWASSLNTIDGGYIGRRMGHHITTAAFAGSTPDPTAWNYDPRRQIAGTLVNYEAGSWETFRVDSTTGIAVTRLAGKPEREYMFLENSLFAGRYFSIYHNLELDKLTPGRFGNTESGVAITRSFLTLRYQPHKKISFDVNHNRFRNAPTFDLRLLGTGLLDQMLFQGISGGFRLELPDRIMLYANLGQNKRSDESGSALNQMYGITFNNFLESGVRIDLRTNRFYSSFGRGDYRSVTLTREFRDRLRMELTGGDQEYYSSLSAQHRTLFMNSTFDWMFGARYFAGGGWSFYRGQVQNYDQILINIGYRF